MIRKELEKYIGKIVSVKLFDDKEYTGELIKTGDKRYEKVLEFCCVNWYFIADKYGECISPLFRTSHVKTCRSAK